MKKLTISLVGALAAAAAYSTEYIPLEGFEGNFSIYTDETTTLTTQKWLEIGGSTTVAEYETGEAPDDSRTSYTTGNKYLKVETDTSELVVAVNGFDSSDNKPVAGEIPGTAAEAIFVDTLVQFTASQTAPVPGDEDKLIVWLAADDVSGVVDYVYNEEPESDGRYGLTEKARESVTGGLKVTALRAYNNADDVYKPFVYDLQLDTPVESGSWHRLTIKTFKTEVVGSQTQVFRIYIDGVETAVPAAQGQEFTVADPNGKDMLAKLDDATGSLFVSLRGRDSTQTISSVVFQGEGALENFIVATSDAIEGTFAEPGSTLLAFTLTVSDNWEEALGEADEATGDAIIIGQTPVEPGDIELKAGETTTLKLKPNEGYTVTVKLNDTELEASVDEDGIEDGIAVYTFTPTVAGTIAITITKGDEPGPGDEQPEIDPSSGSTTATVKPASDSEADIEAAAQAAIKLPEGVDAANLAAYQALFGVVNQTSNGDGTYTVTIALKTDEKDNAESAIITALATAVEGDNDLQTLAAGSNAEVTVNAVPGLYYGIVSGTSLTAVADAEAKPATMTLATESTVTITVAPPSNETGFFKGYVSATDDSSNE
ncbi:MAG: hypothetical protein IJ802_06715 [Kiritimatiellae bacterium]|nr:hypothetical protein [Kiritimatiellia bacterium]